jgi:hypothetical protein
MQVVISAICTSGRSLREAIGGAERALEAHNLAVDKRQTPGRQPGWLKLRSAERERGAINVEWDKEAQILTARVITRGSARPSPIVGDFINYLLASHGRRIRVVTTAFVR